MILNSNLSLIPRWAVPSVFFESLLKGGSGSQRLLVNHSSNSLAGIFAEDNYPDQCNIELRPKGIIVHFRSRLDMFSWAIPGTDLKASQVEQSWRIEDNMNHMVLSGANNRPLSAEFYSRLTSLAANQ